MLCVALFGAAFAACGLPADIDPNGACVTDLNGFSALDADSPGVPISLEISVKDATTDAFRVDHPATSGALDDHTASDGRYILACKQVAGLKTVKMSVSRPADMTAFGAEWVQLFPKDSWGNVTNEYEPFTFNEFGAKIPALRATPAFAIEATKEDVLHVFMEVSDDGDYEVMYGNPGLQYNDKWIAVQFRSTLLRVGAPWADCSGSTLGAASYDVGSIMPILFGGPNLNSIALPAGNPSYFDVIAELSGVTVPVKIVLEIFSASRTSYTDSAESYGKCYKSGNACPEGHSVCKAEYCEMDVWKQLIADFKAAGSVTVLGSLDSSTAATAYDDLDMDGFYLVSTGGSGGAPGGEVDLPFVDQGVGECVDQTGFLYRNRWASGITKEQCEATAAMQVGGGLAVKGYTWCGNSNNAGGTFCRVAHKNGHWVTPPYYFRSSGSPQNEIGDVAAGPSGMDTGECNEDIHCWATHPDTSAASVVTVSALGAPLFDDDAVDDATVYVTLADNDLGVWNPFSWYPYVAPSKWAAIVTEATDVSAVETLVDRGYGWIYITSEVGFSTKSTLAMSDLLAALESPATRRKLRERRLEASAPYWGCDDTLLECKPICMKQMGVVSTRVSDTLCASAPIDQCACKCFHEAQWTCEGSSVVCKAKYGAGELQTVGDKVCETRGAPKPSSTAELSVASKCEPVTEMRGSAPTAECLAQWGTPEPTDAPEQAETADRASLLDQSFAATSALALACLALYA
jgi:hypothetical protein